MPKHWVLYSGDYLITDGGEVRRVCGDPVVCDEQGPREGMSFDVVELIDAIEAFEDRGAKVLDYSEPEIGGADLWGL